MRLATFNSRTSPALFHKGWCHSAGVTREPCSAAQTAAKVNSPATGHIIPRPTAGGWRETTAIVPHAASSNPTVHPISAQDHM